LVFRNLSKKIPIYVPEPVDLIIVFNDRNVVLLYNLEALTCGNFLPLRLSYSRFEKYSFCLAVTLI